MTERVTKWLADLRAEVERLREIRAELKKCHDPRRRSELNAIANVILDEASSPYFALRSGILRRTRGTDDENAAYAEIKKLDRIVRGRRIKVYPPITPGAWALTFVSFADRAKECLEFDNGETFALAHDADGVWDVIVKLLETANPDGYAYLGSGWQGAFSRGGDSDSDRLLKFIHAKAQGRDGKGWFRLMDEPHAPRHRYEG